MPAPDYHQSIEISRNRRIRELQAELPDVCADFFSAISQTTSSLTRLAYAYDLRLFFQYLCAEQPQFADTDMRLITTEQIGQITARQLRGFQDYLTQYIKPADDEGGELIVNNHELGIMRKLCALRSFFEYLFKNVLIPGNVATLVPLPKRHSKPILYLEPNEVERLLTIADQGEGLSKHQQSYQKMTRKRDVAILSLFLGTGIRVSELVGIDLEDLDFTMNGFLVTRKGGNQTILYFSDEVEQVLKDYLKLRREMTAVPGNEDALFLSLQNRRISVRAVQNMVKKYATQAAPLKKHLSPHKLRSTFGTNLYHETGDIYLVADVLGHSDVNTTRRHYAAMSDDRRRMAAQKVRAREDSRRKPELDSPIPAAPADAEPDDKP